MNALKKVLVVDDDPVVSKSIDRVLSRKGYLVVSAENGEEALRKIANEDYEAVFTDIKMPGMDGIEVAEQVRSKRPWTPIVIVTGFGSAENEARAKAAGVSGFIRKPLSPDMIEKGLDAAIATPAMATEVRTVEAKAEPESEALAPQPRGLGVFLKNVAMFLAAPFIALAYVALFPFIGFGMLVWTGGHALRHRKAAS